MLLLLRFDSKTVKKPIISSATLKTNALLNILKAEVGARKGEMIVEVSDEKVKEVEKVLKEMDVQVEEIKEGIVVSESCVHCGACISICPAEVFKFDEERKLSPSSEKCIHCGICVRVCPVSALYFPL